MKRVSVAMLTLVCSLFGTAQADVFVKGDAKLGEQKAKSCGACHGPQGNSLVAANPKLAGQNAKYLVAQLKHFKDGSRSNPQMSPMAANLSEQDMRDIAVYYSEQKVKTGAAKEDLVALGEQIYRGGNKATGVAACNACHGPRGEGNPAANFPALAGQHGAYAEAQLFAYRKEQRTNPMADVMAAVTLHMSDKEIRAVASYLEGLH